MEDKGKEDSETSSTPEKNKQKLSLPDHIKKDQLKAIENTYEIYSNESLEIERKSRETVPPESTPSHRENIVVPPPEEIVPPVPEKNFENILERVVDKAFEKKSDSKKTAVKKIVFEIDSIEELTPELQNNIKKLLNNISKDEVNNLIREIEVEQEKILKGNDGIFGKLNSKEKNQLEKKLEEMEVSRDITEVNLSAILACLNKLVVE